MEDLDRYERGNRLKKLIEILGFTGKSFAETIGMSQGAVSNVITGKRAITIELVDRISQRHSNVNILWLLFGQGSALKNDDMVMEDSPPYLISKKKFAEEPKHISQNLEMIRRRWGLSQAELGALIGATRSQVSNWERGRTMPAVDELHRLALLAGVSADRLHTSVLPPDSVALAPGSVVKLPAEDSAILQVLNKINDNLSEIKELLSKPKT